MRAVVADGAGGPEILSVQEVPDLEPGPGEVLIEVAATAVNRADLLQREGHYPPPPGASETIGLECSGTVAALGEGVEDREHGGTWSVGDEVCALLAGGGYASQVVCPVGQLMPLPPGVDLVSAAAVPEVTCTVWSNLYMVGGLDAGQSLLVHGGAGGIGTVAIQLASARGSRVFTTGGTTDKLELCRSLGAEVAINYRDDDFVAVVKQATDGAGVDVILDNMGASYLTRNVKALATEGRLVVIGMQGGATGELPLGIMLPKRASVTATSLRGRPPAEKAEICAQVAAEVWPLVAEGKVRPIIHGTMALEQVVEAHELMESGEHSGKIILTL